MKTKIAVKTTCLPKLEKLKSKVKIFVETSKKPKNNSKRKKLPREATWIKIQNKTQTEVICTVVTVTVMLRLLRLLQKKMQKKV